jgi:mRNA interferase RelE/StbE
LRAVLQQDPRRIVGRVEAPAHNPWPHGHEKLSGEERYRVRQGDYRIVYAIDGDSRTVEVVKIGHRREAYRR